MKSMEKGGTSRGALVDAYLADLERALVRVGVTDREEVFSNIVEHIDEQRSNDSSAESIVELLKQLGSVDDIARSAAEGEGADFTLTLHAPQKHNDDLTPLIVAVVALVLCLFVPPVGFLLAIGEAGVVLLRSRKKAAPWSFTRKTALVVDVIGVALSVIILFGSLAFDTSKPEVQLTPPTPVEQNAPTNP